jgi:hypothetical protein
MAQRSPAPSRRGTKVLGGGDQDTAIATKPWWRGAAIAGTIFVFLLILTLALRATGGSGSKPVGSPDPSGGPSAPTTVTTAAGGNPATSAHTIRDGVPVGYAHTRQGAVEAAVNYEIARSSPAYFTDTAVRHRVIEAMATRESRADLIRNDDTGMKQVLVSLGVNDTNADTLVARAAAMGTKVDSYSSTVATVEVWMAGLIGTTSTSAPLPVSASWTTYTLTVQWQDGDWRLATVNSVAGPTPLDTGGSDPSSVSDFRTADRAFDAPPYIG